MSGVTTPSACKAVAITGLRRAEVIDWPVNDSPLADDEIAGRTLSTLISPGTELNANFDRPQDKPLVGGYAAVFEVDAIGAEVKQFAPGQRVFCYGNHKSWQRCRASEAVLLPESLAPEVAVFARLMVVSWSTLTTTTARPPDWVLVLGLGVIGNLAAQIFHAAGYRVTGVDPAETRRRLAAISIADTRVSVAGQEDLVNQVALAIDCSGHEQAVVDACRVVRKRGEVVLVGVPWNKRSEATAFDVLHAVFHRYVVLRSGWEWELPRQARDFTVGSLFGNAAGALQWLAEKRVSVEGLYRVVPPAEAQTAYEDLLHQRGEQLSVVFDWR